MKYTNAIVWDHRGRVPKGGKGQVEIRITINRKSYHFGTGVKIHKSELVAGQIINCPGADELNKRVTIIYSKVLACVNEAIAIGAEINTEEIRKSRLCISYYIQLDVAEIKMPLMNMSPNIRYHVQMWKRFYRLFPEPQSRTILLALTVL